LIRIECDAYLTVRDTEGRTASLSDVAPLLELVAETGSIAQAAQAKGLSYRHAWGLLRALESCVGGELIETARGKGSTLSKLGQAVVDAQRLARSRLDGNLRTLAAEVASDLNRWLAQRDGAVRIHASHGYAVAALVSALVDAQAAVDIKYRESVIARVLRPCRRSRAANASWPGSICRAARFASSARRSTGRGSTTRVTC